MAWVNLANGSVYSRQNGWYNACGIEYDNESIGYDSGSKRWYCNIRLWCDNGLNGQAPSQYGSYGTDRKAGYAHNDQGAIIGLDTQIIAKSTTDCWRYYTSAARAYSNVNATSIVVKAEVRNTGYGTWSNDNGTWYNNSSVTNSIPAAPTITSVVNTATSTSSLSWKINATGTNISYGYYYNGQFVSSGSTVTLNNLKSNTRYTINYARVTDAYGRTAQSSSFAATTTGVAPSISNVGAADITENSVEFTFDVSYDTNAILESYKWEYGKTTSYGSEIVDTNILTGLEPNTLYYAKLTVTDSFDRSSSKTYSFTTDELISPTINTVNISNITIDSFYVDISATPGSGDITQYGFSLDDGITWVYDVNSNMVFDSLTEDTEYNVKVLVQNSFGLITHSETYIVKTLSDGVVRIVKEDGTVTKNNMYLIAGDGTVTKITTSTFHIINNTP